MQGVSGRLREVVVYKNRATGGLSRDEVQVIVRPKKWSRSLTGGERLLEVASKALTRKILGLTRCKNL